MKYEPAEPEVWTVTLSRHFGEDNEYPLFSEFNELDQDIAVEIMKERHSLLAETLCFPLYSVHVYLPPYDYDTWEKFVATYCKGWRIESFISNQFFG